MTKLLDENQKPPGILYKYRDFDNAYHRRLISKFELYFSSIKELNDPFEGKAEVDWYKMTYQDCLRKNTELAKAFYPKLKGKELSRLAKKVTDAKQLFHPDNVRFDAKKTEDEWNKILGIVSLTGEINDVHMWSIYANAHKGFAVGLSSQNILDDYDFDYLGVVKYVERLPEISFDDDMTDRFMKKFFTKNLQWRNELEWRITKNHIVNRKQKLSKGAIREIIFGANTRTENKEWCKAKIKKQGVEIKFRQVIISNTDYKIEMIDA